MTDNELIRLFLPIIQDGLLEGGYNNVDTKQANQPTQQGINTQPTVYFFKVSDHRYGFLRRGDVWDSQANQMVHTELQMYETVFQVSALVAQNPKTPNKYTASDLVNEVAAIMQSDKTREKLWLRGVGILRVIEITNPYFSDDRDQFEASPSFTFTLTYPRARVSANPVIQSFEYDIKRV